MTCFLFCFVCLAKSSDIFHAREVTIHCINFLEDCVLIIRFVSLAPSCIQPRENMAPAGKMEAEELPGFVRFPFWDSSLGSCPHLPTLFLLFSPFPSPQQPQQACCRQELCYHSDPLRLGTGCLLGLSPGAAFPPDFPCLPSWFMGPD